MVIHDIRQVVCRKFVGLFPEHLVVQGVCVHFNVTSYQIVHFHHTVVRHPETDGPVVAGFQQRSPFAFRHRNGVSERISCDMVVDEGLAFGFHFRPFRGKLFRSVESIVGISLFYQFFSIFPVNPPPLRLPVRCMRMSFGRCFHHIARSVHTFIRNYAAPVQGLYDIFLRSRYESVGIGVFNPYYEVSAVLTGVQIVV